MCVTNRRPGNSECAPGFPRSFPEVIGSDPEPLSRLQSRSGPYLPKCRKLPIRAVSWRFRGCRGLTGPPLSGRWVLPGASGRFPTWCETLFLHFGVSGKCGWGILAFPDLYLSVTQNTGIRHKILVAFEALRWIALILHS